MWRCTTSNSDLVAEKEVGIGIPGAGFLKQAALSAVGRSDAQVRAKNNVDNLVKDAIAEVIKNSIAKDEHQIEGQIEITSTPEEIQHIILSVLGTEAISFVAQLKGARVEPKKITIALGQLIGAAADKLLSSIEEKTKHEKEALVKLKGLLTKIDKNSLESMGLSPNVVRLLG
jgi:type II secretory pathway component PulM